MKFNFKKITSVLTGLAMLGSTMGMAMAANYPDPFIKNGFADVGIVVGASASALDNIAAVDIASNLQSELSRQTSISNLPSTISSGESINLAGSTNLYFNSELNDARPTLTKSELPTLLNKGKVIDDSGTEYSYEQTLKIGSKILDYDTSGGDLEDPALIIEVGTDSSISNELYQYVLTFNKNLDIISEDVTGNTINILGKDYTIGSDSTSNNLILFGTGTGKTLKEGESTSANIENKDYSIEVKSIEQVGDINYVSISINGGNTRRIAEGNTVKVGDIEIYAKSIHYLAKETQISYADLSLGTTKITLKSGSSVKLGSDETSVYGTLVTIDATGNYISSLKINVAMTKATKDYIKVGESFIDPVFGSLKTQFVSATPDINADSRGSIKVNTDNNRNAKVIFTSDLSGDSDEKVMYFAHDTNEAEDAVSIALSDASNKAIHVVEGEGISINEYTVINAGDYGRIIRLTEIPSELDSNARIQFEDVITGQNLFDGGLTVGTSGETSTNIDGQTYYFDVDTTLKTVAITYGSGADINNVGDQITLYPRIKLSDGEWMAFVKPVSVTNSVTYSMPGKENLADYESGSNLSLGPLGNGYETLGNIKYNISSNIVSDIQIDGTNYPINGAGILFIEEKKSNSDNGDAIYVGLDTDDNEISIAKPTVTGISSDLISMSGDSNKQTQVTKYGSFIEYNSDNNDEVTISYPNEQMTLDVAISAIDSKVTNAGQAITELGSVAVMDSEIESVSSKNLIVLGGSCINTVAAKILGSDSPICGPDFTAKTDISLNQFLVKVIESPYQTDKVAMLVAGYEGKDTRKAISYLISNKPSTLVGTEIKQT